MPASVRGYIHTIKTLDLERYVAMYQRKPTTRPAAILPEPLAGTIVVVDGLITNATAPDGGDDRSNPQRVWAFTVDDGSGGVNVVASKAQVMPMLMCMETSSPVYIVARLRFAHEVGSAEAISSMVGWPRQPDDLVCEVLRAGASEGLGLRADDTPEVQDEERERQHREQLAAIATEGMADVPAPAARSLRREVEEETSPTVDLPRVTMKSTDGRTLAEYPRSTPPPHERAAASLQQLGGPPPAPKVGVALLGGPSLAEVSRDYMKSADEVAGERLASMWSAICQAFPDLQYNGIAPFELSGHPNRLAFIRLAGERAAAPFRTAPYSCPRHHNADEGRRAGCGDCIPGGSLGILETAHGHVLHAARQNGLSVTLEVICRHANHGPTTPEVLSFRFTSVGVDSGHLPPDAAWRWVEGFASARAAKS